MSAFEYWDEKPRDKSVPMNLDGLREEAFNAGLKLAADMLEHIANSHSYELTSDRRELAAINALILAATDIRKEISND